MSLCYPPGSAIAVNLDLAAHPCGAVLGREILARWALEFEDAEERETIASSHRAPEATTPTPQAVQSTRVILAVPLSVKRLRRAIVLR